MRSQWIAAVVMAAAAAVAAAKLPPLTAEETQAAAARSEQQKANLEKEKILLDKAQDRVVEYYKRTTGAAGASTARGGQTQGKNISQKAVEPAGAAGPQGGREQSAEAHSAPAK